MIEVNQLIADFSSVARLAGVSIPDSAVAVELLRKPHVPPSTLPPGKMAVYLGIY